MLFWNSISRRFRSSPAARNVESEELLYSLAAESIGAT
jgi:hypothetical protein